MSLCIWFPGLRPFINNILGSRSRSSSHFECAYDVEWCFNPFCCPDSGTKTSTKTDWITDSDFFARVEAERWIGREWLVDCSFKRSLLKFLVSIFYHRIQRVSSRCVGLNTNYIRSANTTLPQSSIFNGLGGKNHHIVLYVSLTTRWRCITTFVFIGSCQMWVARCYNPSHSRGLDIKLILGVLQVRVLSSCRTGYLEMLDLKNGL